MNRRNQNARRESRNQRGPRLCAATLALLLAWSPVSAFGSSAATIQLVDGQTYEVADWGCVRSAPRRAPTLDPGATAYYRYDDQTVEYVPLHHGPLRTEKRFSETVTYTVPAVVVHFPQDRIEQVEVVPRSNRIPEVSVVLTDGTRLNGYLRDTEGFNDRPVLGVGGRTTVAGLEGSKWLNVSSVGETLRDQMRRVVFRREDGEVAADLEDFSGKVYPAITQVRVKIGGGDSRDDSARVNHLSVTLDAGTFDVPLDQIRSVIRSSEEASAWSFEGVVTLRDGKELRGSVSCYLEGTTTFRELPARFSSQIENIRSIVVH